MKKMTITCAVVVFLFTAVSGAHAASYTFSDKDFIGGAAWGEMEITIVNDFTLRVKYGAAGSIPNSLATGFGFQFSPSVSSPIAINNPLDATFSFDQDDLDWIVLNNLSAIPNPSNGDEFSPAVDKFDFFFGATEGNANNFTPPGIAPGKSDIFYLDFGSQNNFFLGLNDDDIFDVVLLAGVRLQGIDTNAVPEGSLFLAAGNPVPIPGAAWLLGAGLVGVVSVRRRSFKS